MSRHTDRIAVSRHTDGRGTRAASKGHAPSTTGPSRVDLAKAAFPSVEHVSRNHSHALSPEEARMNGQAIAQLGSYFLDATPNHPGLNKIFEKDRNLLEEVMHRHFRGELDQAKQFCRDYVSQFIERRHAAEWMNFDYNPIADLRQRIDKFLADHSNRIVEVPYTFQRAEQIVTSQLRARMPDFEERIRTDPDLAKLVHTKAYVLTQTNDPLVKRHRRQEPNNFKAWLNEQIKQIEQVCVRKSLETGAEKSRLDPDRRVYLRPHVPQDRDSFFYQDDTQYFTPWFGWPKGTIGPLSHEQIASLSVREISPSSGSIFRLPGDHRDFRLMVEDEKGGWFSAVSNWGSIPNVFYQRWHFSRLMGQPEMALQELCLDSFISSWDLQLGKLKELMRDDSAESEYSPGSVLGQLQAMELKVRRDPINRGGFMDEGVYCLLLRKWLQNPDGWSNSKDAATDSKKQGYFKLRAAFRRNFECGKWAVLKSFVRSFVPDIADHLAVSLMSLVMLPPVLILGAMAIPVLCLAEGIRKLRTSSKFPGSTGRLSLSKQAVKAATPSPWVKAANHRLTLRDLALDGSHTSIAGAFLAVAWVLTTTDLPGILAVAVGESSSLIHTPLQLTSRILPVVVVSLAALGVVWAIRGAASPFRVVRGKGGAHIRYLEAPSFADLERFGSTVTELPQSVEGQRSHIRTSTPVSSRYGLIPVLKPLNHTLDAIDVRLAGGQQLARGIDFEIISVRERDAYFIALVGEQNHAVVYDASVSLQPSSSTITTDVPLKICDRSAIEEACVELYRLGMTRLADDLEKRVARQQQVEAQELVAICNRRSTYALAEGDSTPFEINLRNLKSYSVFIDKKGQLHAQCTAANGFGATILSQLLAKQDPSLSVDVRGGFHCRWGGRTLSIGHAQTYVYRGSECIKRLDFTPQQFKVFEFFSLLWPFAKASKHESFLRTIQQGPEKLKSCPDKTLLPAGEEMFGEWLSLFGSEEAKRAQSKLNALEKFVRQSGLRKISHDEPIFRAYALASILTDLLNNKSLDRITCHIERSPLLTNSFGICKTQACSRIQLFVAIYGALSAEIAKVKNFAAINSKGKAGMHSRYGLAGIHKLKSPLSEVLEPVLESTGACMDSIDQENSHLGAVIRELESRASKESSEQALL